MLVLVSTLGLLLGITLWRPIHEVQKERVNNKLLRAARMGEDQHLAEALDEGADVRVYDTSGHQALHYAVKWSNASMVARLLAAGADVNAASGDGRSTLCLAQDVEMARQLLQAGAQVNPRASRFPLEVQIASGNLPLVELLLQRGAPIDPHGRTSSLRGVIDSPMTPDVRLQIARRLIEHGAEVTGDPVSDLTNSPVSHMSLIELAVNRSDGGMVDLLRENGVPYTIFDAVELNRHEDVQSMLREEPSLRSRVKNIFHTPPITVPSTEIGITPLGIALARGHQETSRVLIDAGAPLDAVTENPGDTLLHLAVMGRNAILVRELLERGLDVNARNTFNWTPLKYAIYAEDEAVVRILIDAGADPPASKPGSR